MLLQRSGEEYAVIPTVSSAAGLDVNSATHSATGLRLGGFAGYRGADEAPFARQPLLHGRHHFDCLKT